MDKFTVFREMLDYMAHIANVTDADMNYYRDAMRITGQTDEQEICIEVTFSVKEEKSNDKS